VRGPEWWNQIKTFLNVGAVFESLKCADILKFTLRIPPLGEQRNIADILGALDGRIEFLQNENASLGQIAQAIFKSWFVDFDPVRAKAEGREPEGMDPDTAGLFPCEFQESEFGAIPNGWQTLPVGDLATVMGGSTPSTKEPEYWEGGEHAWATPKDLSALTTPILLSTEKRVTSQGLARISSGLLAPGTLLLSSRAPIGYLAIAEIPTAINQGFIAMKPNDGISNLFLLCWTRTSHEAILSRANGSTFLEISKSAFRPMPVIVPSPEIMASFDTVVRPLYEAMVNNEKQFRTLANLRDTLLPRLISGKLRVPEAEAMLTGGCREV
jgi:type I restriction enzyme S subunit